MNLFLSLSVSGTIGKDTVDRDVHNNGIPARCYVGEPQSLHIGLLQFEEIAECLRHIYGVQGSLRGHYESHNRYVVRDNIAIYCARFKLS